MLLLKLGSELQNLVKKLQSAMNILTKHKLHFHEVCQNSKYEQVLNMAVFSIFQRYTAF